MFEKYSAAVSNKEGDIMLNGSRGKRNQSLVCSSMAIELRECTSQG